MFLSIRSSLLRKLTLAIMLVTVVPLLVVVFTYFNLVSRNNAEAKVKSGANALSQMAVTMNVLMDSFDKYAEYLANDERISGFVTFEQDDAECVDVIMNYIKPWVDRLKLCNGAIRNIRILHRNTTVFNMNNILFCSDDIGMQVSHLLEISDTRLPIKAVEYCAEGHFYAFTPYSVQDKDVWYIYHTLSPMNLDNPLGLVEISIDNEALCGSIREYSLDGDQFIQLVSQNSQVVYHKGDAPAESIDYHRLMVNGQHLLTIDGRRYTVVSHRVELLDSSLLLFMPQDELLLSGQTSILLILIVILLILSILGIAVLVSRLILKKLLLLTREVDGINMESIDQLIHVDSPDEAGRLAHSFNMMLKRLATAFVRERDMLQAQLTNNLKPHFICNTMDMLRIQSEQQGQMGIAQSISKINQYFRYTMMYSGDTVSLMEELKDTINYIELVNLLQQNKIRYSLSLDAWIEKNGRNIQVPKLILQPVVENSVRHGLAAKTVGCITIQIKREDEEVLIIVSDNGTGIPPDKLTALQNSLQDGGSDRPFEDGHMGLMSVYRRLELLFNGNFRVDIESTPAAGTIVTIRFKPLNER